MHSELYTLSKIFTEQLYRIPDYQRGYSWTERQLKDFWSDLMLLESDRKHYTGVLTLEEVPPEEYRQWVDDLWIIESKSYKPFYVVDGQQRLTTSLILVQSLLERIKNGEKLKFMGYEEIQKKYIFESKDEGVSRSYIFGYAQDNPSYNFWSQIFLWSTRTSTRYQSKRYTRKTFKPRRTSSRPSSNLCRSQNWKKFS